MGLWFVSAFGSFTFVLALLRLEKTVPSPVPSFRVVVLTWTRHRALRRLLRSLEHAHYNGSVIQLELHFDGPTEKKRREWNQTMGVAQTFHFSHGEKIIKVARENGGLRRAWLNAWPSAGLEGDVQTLILEDDIEVSPWWFKWLTIMWKTYGHRNDLGGITLNRQQQLATKGWDGEQFEVLNGNLPFLNKIVGSWGFSPHPRHWRRFLDSEREWINSTPKIGKLGINRWMKTKKGSVWTMFWMKWSLQRNLYTLYVTCPGKTALAIHHREAGEHFVSTQGARYTVMKQWPTLWNRKPPSHLKLYGWDLKAIAN